jgi:phosphate:Na+ symporter
VQTMFREIGIPFLIGLCVFMIGLHFMRTGLEALAANRLQDILLKFTRTPFRGFVTGTITTAFLQSSSAITVLTIGFVNAGVLTFAQSIGIILGSNIGTTITTQILALKIEDFALPLLILGTILWMLPQLIVSRLGKTTAGFGMIFLGIDYMQKIASPIKEHGLIQWVIDYGGHPILAGIVIGAVFTALIHSSSACIAITMGFYASHAIPLPFAIAVVFGSNVGTCVTAILAAVNANTASKQVALSHFLLNLAGVILFAPLIPLISQFTPYLSDNPATQIAHIQTLFNVICSVAVLPFCEPFARGITYLIPDETVTWKRGDFHRLP